MKMLEWLEKGLVAPMLVQSFESVLYKLYKPDQWSTCNPPLRQLTLRSSGWQKAALFAIRWAWTLACEKPALFRPMFYSPAFTFSSDYSLGFGFLAGLRLWMLRQFSVFLQAVRRLGGTLLFRGLRSSSIWGFPFWRLGLTVQSSRPAFGRRLTFVR